MTRLLFNRDTNCNADLSNMNNKDGRLGSLPNITGLTIKII